MTFAPAADRLNWTNYNDVGEPAATQYSGPDVNRLPADVMAFLDELADIIHDRETQEWRANAACRGMDPDVFVSKRGDVVSQQLAKAVCASCPVQEECGEYGLQFSVYTVRGTYGGLSSRGRDLVRRGEQVA